ncbi:MAG: hypothetical protein ACLFN2_02175 [Bacteroidales bacterium]
MNKFSCFPRRLSLLVLIVMLTAGCSQKIIYQSRWQPTALQPDQIPLDWEASAEQDPSGKLGYSISNDNDNLYIYFKTADRTMQLKMLRAGVQLDIDSLGGEESHMAIRFPYYPDGEKASESVQMPLSGSQGSRPVAVNSALAERTTMYVTGFPGVESGPVDHVHSGNGMVRMQMDESENMYYWAVLPLRFFPSVLTGQAEGDAMAIRISVLGIYMGQEMAESSGGSGLYRPVPGRRDETIMGWPGDRPERGNGGAGRNASLDELQRTQTFRTVFQLARAE